MSRTLPATVVTMSFCIFIASRTATTSPSFTSSPVLIGILTIKPCMGATTVPSPAFGAAAALGPGAAPGLAVGRTDIPAPVTRTLKTSPSTSTSNSAVDCGAAAAAGGGGGGQGAAAGEGGSGELADGAAAAGAAVFLGAAGFSLR